MYTQAAAGYPGVFAHGMLTMGMAGRLLTDWFGDGRLTRYGVCFVNQVWPGDAITATATVAAIREEQGTHFGDVSVVADNQNGTKVLTGTASARVDP